MATFVEQIKDFSSAVLTVVGARILPTGGSAGQIPVKVSSDNGDVVWQTPSGVTKGKVVGLNSKQYL